MKIKKLILRDFRNFEGEQTFDFEDLTAIIGKNDLGKSTLLEAIDIFINDKKATVRIDKDDLCKRTEKEELSIGMVFSDFPEKVNIDEGNETSLENEYLLNEKGFLEIHKRFKNGKTSGVFIRAIHPTSDEAKELLLKKQQDLKKIVEDNEYECENKTKNALLRKSIRDNSQDLMLKTTDIPADEQDAKKIWTKLEDYLPLYALFQSDRKNTGEDSEVQDPMKLAVKEILEKESIKVKLRNIADEVEKKSKEIARETLKKLEEMNPDIAKKLEPIIPPIESLKWDSVFKNIEISSDEGVPLNKRGSGVRRLVLLNFLRARAEETKEENSINHIVYAIEEPETSQHPEHQKILMKALKELSEHDERQVFITTHSPSLVRLLPSENIKLLRNIQDKNIEMVGGDLAFSEIIEELGVLPLIEKTAIFVEGEFDREFLLNINKNVNELKEIIDISKLSIIPLGGSILERWVNRNYLDGSNIIEFHLYDKDSDEKYKESVEKINERPSSKGVLTNKLEMENYIHPSLIEDFDRFENLSFEEIADNWDEEDIPSFIKSNVDVYKQKISPLGGLERAEQVKKCEIEIKEILNARLSKQMTKELFEDLEAWEEIKGWFETIREMCA